ncbi:MAG: efflux RND transporter permease subunit, partial [Candidatus Hydrogenedentes bacterium]|nr:efflux RND transporter permease subunit [Candidatus Hydrogenedentota bacterium]
IQVQINTVAPALNGEEIEQQITQPIELAVSGLPGLASVRSVSKFGLSQVVATFSDATSIFDARQFILERMGSVELPESIERPELGPISTGLGEVFHYLVRSEDPEWTLEKLRTLHDWVIKPELLKVSGVAEVNSWGGYERQYEVVAKPESLIAYGITLAELFEALENNNRNVGGGEIVESGQSYLVHGLGRVSGLDDIGRIVIRTVNGLPIHVHDVAGVQIGHEIRRGAVTAEGKGEAVLGLAFMLMGENSHEVTRALRERLDSVRPYLPEGVEVQVVYDRTQLVYEVLNTVRHNLTSGAVLVVAVLLLLLGSIQAGILVAIAIPMAMLFAALGMYELGIAASLLSLGAIDFGILVDGSVVMAELNLRRLAEKTRALGRRLTEEERVATVAASATEVARPILFGMGIITIVFLPILTLEGTEGKLFRPMALTFISALAGALLIALFLSPALSYYFLPRRFGRARFSPMRWIEELYARILRGAVAVRGVILGSVAVLLAVTVVLALRLGGEFLPRLSEGSTVVNVVRLAGIALDESIAYNTKMEQLLLEEFPNEIEHIWTRIGTAEVATDPMGIELSDIFMTLKPREQWVRASSQEELVGEMESALAGLPGQNPVFTQPIEMRMNELISGIRSDIGIIVFGDDFAELDRISQEIQAILVEIEGAADVSADQLTGLPILWIDVQPEHLEQFGVPAADVLDFIQALGNRQVGEVFEGQRVFPLVVRLPEDLRDNRALLRQVLVPNSAGAVQPLALLADVREEGGYATINREWGRRVMRVQTNVRGRDVVSFLEEAQRRVAESVKLPEGYVIDWSGQFENLQRSQRRLALVVPLTLLIVFILLYFSLGQLRDVLIVYSGIPFAAVGGVLALYWRGIPFSVSAAVGFIALAGIAVLNGQIMIEAMRRASTQHGIARGLIEGARQRLRPVLATTITDALGFLPMALSTGVGAEVQRPLATVVVAGVASSTLLTLFVLPILYRMTHRE